MQSLDSILKGDLPEAVEQPKAEETKVEVKAETPEPTAEEAKAQRERDEQGRFKAKSEETAKAEAKPEPPKVEKKAEPTPAEKPKPEAKADDAEPLDSKAKAYYAKAKDEQRKRQELERRLQELERTIQQPQQQIDPLKDPEGFANRIAQQAEARAWDRILNFSEANARRSYGEELVTEARDTFLEEMQGNQALYIQLQQQADPYDWVVKRFKREKFVREVGDDPDAWTKQREATIRQQVEAELAQKFQQQPRPAPVTPPPSLANATATGPVTGKSEWAGPTPLKSILRR